VPANRTKVVQPLQSAALALPIADRVIDKRQLGNFPQAFTHLALVNSARIVGGDSKMVPGEE